MLRHSWSGVSLCKGENVVRDEMPVCKVLVHWVQGSSETVAFCWCRFTEHGWQAQRTSWKDHPNTHCLTFSQKNCHALSQWKKVATVSTFIDCYEKTTNLNIIQTRCFPFCCSLNFLQWVGEGKDPESLEDCGGELMLLIEPAIKQACKNLVEDGNYPHNPETAEKFKLECKRWRCNMQQISKISKAKIHRS